jgi:hypothetical protein
MDHYLGELSPVSPSSVLFTTHLSHAFALYVQYCMYKYGTSFDIRAGLVLVQDHP